MTIYRRANRQYIAMSENEAWSFVASRYKMIVAFSMPNGYSHATPIWFAADNRKLYFRFQDYKVKSRLIKSGKVCCVLEEGHSYTELRGVVIWGRCHAVTDHALVSQIEEWLTAKYGSLRWRREQMPLSWVNERSNESRIHVQVDPEIVSSWDNRKLLQKGDNVG
jgi:nitroimidazol reductase NimA-like FMN-containing flavoprotein (pyridoxamine 5'-phosphate oxidase superfamily)